MFVKLVSSLNKKRKGKSLQNSLELCLRLHSPYICLIFTVFLFSSTTVRIYNLIVVLARAKNRTPTLFKIVTKLLEILLTLGRLSAHQLFLKHFFGAYLLLKNRNNSSYIKENSSNPSVFWLYIYQTA